VFVGAGALPYRWETYAANIGTSENGKGKLVLRRLLLVLVMTAMIATAFVSAALAQRPRESAPPSPSVGASAASDPNAAAPMGAADSVAPSAATSPGAVANTNGALLGWAPALALVVGGCVALGLVVRRGTS
jgi:hypothetical protein